MAPALPAKIIYTEKRIISLKFSGLDTVNLGKYKRKAYTIITNIRKK